MNINQAYPSNFLKADDLGGKSVTVVIQKVEMEEIGQGRDKETKPVLYFRGKEKGVVLNKTNANTITKLYGGETDDWIGKAITLVPREVEFQGEMVLSIRVSLQKPGAPSAKPADPEPPASDSNPGEADPNW